MMRSALPVVLLLALAACGSAPRLPEPPAEPARAEEAPPAADNSESLPVGSSKYRIVEAAKAEWDYFGRQEVVYEGDEESIPRVGIWEDEHDSHSERINHYWRAVGKNRLSGKDCTQPWSAAFISWIMQAAGVPKPLFPPSGAHRSYLDRFLASAHRPYAAWKPHTLQEYRPRPGDLICAHRGTSRPGEATRELPTTLNARLHCDIVVGIKGQTLQAIGGNVRNSVSKSILTLSPDGYLQPTSRRPWFLIVENRLD